MNCANFQNSKVFQRKRKVQTLGFFSNFKFARRVFKNFKLANSYSLFLVKINNTSLNLLLHNCESGRIKGHKFQSMAILTSGSSTGWSRLMDMSSNQTTKSVSQYKHDYSSVKNSYGIQSIFSAIDGISVMVEIESPLVDVVPISLATCLCDERQMRIENISFGAKEEVGYWNVGPNGYSWNCTQLIKNGNSHS